MHMHAGLQGLANFIDKTLASSIINHPRLKACFNMGLLGSHGRGMPRSLPCLRVHLSHLSGTIIVMRERQGRLYFERLWSLLIS